MRNPLQRYYGRGDLHFLAFSCYRRRPLLGSARARHCFVKILGEVRTRFKFCLLGYVITPEHVHLLISEPRGSDPSKALQVLKQRVSQALRRKSRRVAAGQFSFPLSHGNGDAPAFWQRRFYDFNVWSSKKVWEKLYYIHRNPVERKLVSHPEDWPWSSWSHYEKGERGLIPIDVLSEENAAETREQHKKSQSQKPHP